MENVILFSIGDKCMEAFNFRYYFIRNIDHKGRPCTPIRGGTIEIQLEASDDDCLFGRLASRELCDVPLSGSLTVQDYGNGTVIRSLEWEDAFVVSYDEEMLPFHSAPMQVAIVLSPLQLKINDLRLNRRWPETNGFWQRKVQVQVHKISSPSEQQQYDEQVQVMDDANNPIADLLYYVELDGKFVQSGRTDAEGLTERLESAPVRQKYTYYWGEEALAKMENHRSTLNN